LAGLLDDAVHACPRAPVGQVPWALGCWFSFGMRGRLGYQTNSTQIMLAS
jgi:hypothetical protein